ncbi:hypothetical protein DWW47_18710 [Odoribacter splanchnicus]|uniref:Uncharacterized protein n=2 Tax=Odoribacter splanchnicus TaxID=28118 RepID=A0A412VZB9_9BACT|nr:hypothetical protein [Odoribacter splanchnicus]MBV4402507.1 hypothetical protein [Odoribacter splanchnicus]MBV4411153.1 hypothetical protein [Odoribacter splanchnicus]RGU71101.1 hypothetical protein DWW47_18710 [Odoribacter splanchnicus]RGV15433.1 hypothetical protein DWW24_21870 [Odoribacter splanchnicus]RHA76038.1 hypothetical protein DW919_12745 [Odoribacter splanchnicus]
MKTKMLIFVFLLGITDLFAQTLYVPGTIVKGKNASYYCSTKYEILIKLNNVNNVDTTTTMYYDDGTVVPFDEGSAVIETKNEDLVRVFQEALTQKEIDILKSKISYLLMLNIVADKQGNTLEITFSFRNNDPVMTKFTPDRFYQLEQELKKILRLDPNSLDKSIKNIKYIQAISYKDLK